jgi:hypothetical protein
MFLIDRGCPPWFTGGLRNLLQNVEGDGVVSPDEVTTAGRFGFRPSREDPGVHHHARLLDGGKAILNRRNLVVLAVVGLVVCLGGIGCGSSEPEPKDAPSSYQHLKAIQKAYLAATRKLERPPENVKEIMPYLHYEGEGGPEALLRSPNDGQAYKILWGVDMFNAQGRDDGKYPVVAYEQRGKDGKRLVLEVRHIRNLTDEEFKDEVFPPGHKAPI